MDLVERLRSGEDGLEYAAADEIERLRHALEVIAGRKPASDNLVGNIQIAQEALDQ